MLLILHIYSYTTLTHIIMPVVLPSSPQASKIHSGPGQDYNKKQTPVLVGREQASTELDPLLSSEEFKKLQLEVERLGE